MGNAKDYFVVPLEEFQNKIEKTQSALLDLLEKNNDLSPETKAIEKRVDKIKHEDTLLFTSTESSELSKLNSKHEQRLQANENWKFYVDQLQKVVEHYEQFNTMPKEVLDSAMSLYREQNEKFRSTPAPT